MSNKTSNFNKKPWFPYRRTHELNFSNRGELELKNFEAHGYQGFKLYFPIEGEHDHKRILNRTAAFEHYIKTSQQFSFAQIEQQKVFTVDLSLLQLRDDFLERWVDFKNEIENEAEFCITCMGLAMHETLCKEVRGDSCGKTPLHLGVIMARVVNYQPVQLLRHIKVNCIGKLVSVRGTIIKASSTRLLCVKMGFRCHTCKTVQVVTQNEGKYTTPINCPVKGCMAKSRFIALHSDPVTKTVNWQTLKIQEQLGSEQYENGRIPRTIECELVEDLTGCCIPGDDVTVTGIVKVRSINDSGSNGNQFLNYLDAVSIINNKDHNQVANKGAVQIIFNSKAFQVIQQIHSEPNLFRLLVQSMCPNIYGHEIVKAGLLLALVEASQQSFNTRTASHVLVVGDPGLGKSCMLQACANIAPRGVYVCGNISTNSGLTVTVTRDGGGHALEAGALVLADKGCCCIDEFDKMQNQHSCLLEAMEQERISIAKAGMTCTLAARTCILAAANPVGGHYDRSKTVAENLKISSPLLSRFDLVFIILDKPNEALDNRLSEHVLALHSKSIKKTSQTTNNLNLQEESSVTLKDRLHVMPGEEIDHVPHCLFRKYIAYAQKYVHPKLSDKAKKVLGEFYLQLRKQLRAGDSLPVTARQLESLVRLTQARARIELREEATLTDALEVIEIMRHSLIDVLTDEFDVIDTTATPSVTGMSNMKLVKKLLAELQQSAENQTRSLYNLDQLRKLASNVGVPKTKFYDILHTLNVQGFLLKKGNDLYQLTIVDF